MSRWRAQWLRSFPAAKPGAMRLIRNIVATLILISLQLAVLSSAQETSRATVTILSTTDLHGNIYPIDYNTNKPERRGLARLATVVKQARLENPDLLLLDSGDTIQGTPLTFHHAKIDNKPPDPMMTVMSA